MGGSEGQGGLRYPFKAGVGARLGSRVRPGTTALTIARTTPTAAGTGGGQLLAGLLKHRLRIGTGTHDPRHDVVATGGRIEQQRRAQAQPAVDELLLRLHRYRHNFGVRTAQGRIPGALTTPLAGSIQGTFSAAISSTAVIVGALDTSIASALSAVGGGFGRLSDAATATAAAAAATVDARSGHHLCPHRGGRTHQA